MLFSWTSPGRKSIWAIHSAEVFNIGPVLVARSRWHSETCTDSQTTLTLPDASSERHSLRSKHTADAKLQYDFSLCFLSPNTVNASSILSPYKASLRWDIHLFLLLSAQVSLPRHGCINMFKCKKVQDADALLAHNKDFFSKKQHTR